MPNVSFTINGEPITPVSLGTGLSAPYVCGGSPGIWHPQCNRNSGFTAKIETRNLPNGVHKLVVGATNYLGVPSRLERTIIVSNSCFDTLSPTVSMTSPNTPQVIGVVNVTASATDNVGITGVEFLIDGVSTGVDTTAPYSYRWNTALSSAGPHVITAIARDGCFNDRVEKRTVTVVHDTTLPQVSLLSPTHGSWIRGTVAIQAQASDNVEVTKVDFLVNDVVKATDTVPPFTYNWTPPGDGSYTLRARAYDSSGNDGLSSPVSVGVDSTPPQLGVAAPTFNQTVYGSAVRLAGWATDGSDSVSLSFLLNGQSLNLNTGGITWLARQDVCDTVPTGDSRCPYVGWRGYFDSTRYPNGWYTLDIIATDAAGSATLSRLSIYISNAVSPVVLRFNPIADAWTRELFPNNNYGMSTQLGVRSNWSTDDGGFSFLKFNVTGVSGTIVSAKLLLRTLSVPLTELYVYKVASSWTETGITWANMPVDSSLDLTHRLNLAASTWYDFDASSYVIGNGVWSFGIASADVAPGLGVSSRETAYSPVLEIIYRP